MLFRLCALILFFPRSAPIVDAEEEFSLYVMESEREIGFSQKLKVTEDSPIFSKKSAFQDISVHVSAHYGKILVLDDVVQITERDGNSYNEMMAHIPMMEHARPRNVLVVGGGDGYVLSEVLKHESVELVDHVDLDTDVIETCKRYFSWGAAWDDERVTLHIRDGASFVKNAPTGFYDVVVQDSSDPTAYGTDGKTILLPSSVLYSQEHFDEIFRILKGDGVFNFQAETFNIPSDLESAAEWRDMILESGFQSAIYGNVMTSSYIGGQIGFMMSKKNDQSGSSAEEIEARFQKIQMGKPTSYYHPILQTSAFHLPLWVTNALYAPKECQAGQSEGCES